MVFRIRRDNSTLRFQVMRVLETEHTYKHSQSKGAYHSEEFNSRFTGLSTNTKPILYPSSAPLYCFRRLTQLDFRTVNSKCLDWFGITSLLWVYGHNMEELVVSGAMHRKANSYDHFSFFVVLVWMSRFLFPWTLYSYSKSSGNFGRSRVDLIIFPPFRLHVIFTFFLNLFLIN